MAGVFSFALAGCLVAGPNYVVYDAPQKAGKAVPAANINLAEQVRARLLGECMSEHGKALRPDDQLGKQCDCFAGDVVKSMAKDDQEFYLRYGVVPTLSSARPDDVKKKCGIAVIDQSGSRGKPPPPQVY
jgi:hypothetical protein